MTSSQMQTFSYTLTEVLLSKTSYSYIHDRVLPHLKCNDETKTVVHVAADKIELPAQIPKPNIVILTTDLLHGKLDKMPATRW